MAPPELGPHSTKLQSIGTGGIQIGVFRISPIIGVVDLNVERLQKGGVGRAVIRLTKGRDYLRDDVDAPTLEFADLTKPPEKRYEDERPADQLTLFLERPYFKNANYSETAVIKQMFISLVRKKAMQMLATPVLAICYEEQCAASDFVRMRYALYISKSKGGAQYLDSLDGQVKVSREGSFKAFPFLVLPSNEMAAIS